jgi:hypothetical protein
MQMSKIESGRFGKRGMLSSFLAFFGATIAIVLILLVFVLSSAVVKKVNKVSSNVAIYNESDAEIDNVFSYSGRYVNLSKARFLMAKGKTLDEALTEVGYE